MNDKLREALVIANALQNAITEELAASKQEPQAQAEPDWKLHQFQSKDGEWHNFVNERHYEATVRHGDWPIRELITLQANREAIAEAVRVVQDDWELDVRQHREAIAKKDAALDACVAALKTYALIDTQAAAAIAQAEGARK